MNFVASAGQRRDRTQQKVVSMAGLHDLLETHVGNGTLPGAVGLVRTMPNWPSSAGRYGWVGGTGTSAHITSATGTVAILLTQVAADSPVPPKWMQDFWRYVSSAC
jgi:hypothetical protein